MGGKDSEVILTVYVRTGCKTCKRAVDYLAAKKLSFHTIDFFKKPFSKDQIKSLLKKADVSPQQALRKKDKMFKRLQLDKRKLKDEEILSLMEKYPGLILRPIVVRGERATIATKPEMINQLLA